MMQSRSAPDALLPRVPRPRRIAARLVLVVGGVLATVTLALLIGMRINDRLIDDQLGTATATVLKVSALRTGIEFTDSRGLTVRPAAGVLYPGLLRVGQQFLVEYDTANPDLVRVAGRTAAVGNLVVALTLTGIVVVTGLVWFWLRRPAYPPPAGPADPNGPEPRR